MNPYNPNRVNVLAQVVAAQHYAKLQTYRALKAKKLPIPADLEQECK